MKSVCVSESRPAGRLAEADSKGRYKICIIKAGQGSSGIYPEEVLENDPGTFNNVLSFPNHTDDPTNRNIFDIVGVVTEQWYEKDSDGVGALWGYFEPSEKVAPLLEKYSGKVGVSIFAMADIEEDEGDGPPTITGFDGSWGYTSVDIVIAAGAGGRFEAKESLGLDGTQGKETMDKVAIEAALAPLGAKLDAIAESNKKLMDLLMPVVEHLAEAKEHGPESDAPDVAESLKVYSEMVAKIEEADLLKTQQDRLRGLAVKFASEGRDLGPLIEEEKAVAQEARQQAPGYGSVEESQGSEVQFTHLNSAWGSI